MTPSAGEFTIACRDLCSALVRAPWPYWTLVTDGDAYRFFRLVLAQITGLALLANCLFYVFRYRTNGAITVSLESGSYKIWDREHFAMQYPATIRDSLDGARPSVLGALESSRHRRNRAIG